MDVWSGTLYVNRGLLRTSVLRHSNKAVLCWGGPESGPERCLYSQGTGTSVRFLRPSAWQLAPVPDLRSDLANLARQTLWRIRWRSWSGQETLQALASRFVCASLRPAVRVRSRPQTGCPSLSPGLRSVPARVPATASPNAGTVIGWLRSHPQFAGKPDCSHPHRACGLPELFLPLPRGLEVRDNHCGRARGKFLAAPVPTHRPSRRHQSCFAGYAPRAASDRQ